MGHLIVRQTAVRQRRSASGYVLRRVAPPIRCDGLDRHDPYADAASHPLRLRSLTPLCPDHALHVTEQRGGTLHLRAVGHFHSELHIRNVAVRLGLHAN